MRLTDEVATDECEARSDCADSDDRHLRDQSAQPRGPRRVVDPQTTPSPPLAHLVVVAAIKSCCPVGLLNSEGVGKLKSTSLGISQVGRIGDWDSDSVVDSTEKRTRRRRREDRGAARRRKRRFPDRGGLRDFENNSRTSDFD